MFDTVVITCEHGGNQVPRAYRALFAGADDVLSSHRGHDPGALELATLLARRGGWPLHFSRTTRLLVELNRSPHHRALLSEFSSRLDELGRAELIDRYYRPYRDGVERDLCDRLRGARRLLHLSIHTFTPVLDGRVRRADIGLLFDPQREIEKSFCAAWQKALKHVRDNLVVRCNYPYRGTSDGFTTYLRGRFSPRRYAGVEMEVNQRWPLGPRSGWRSLRHVVMNSLLIALGRTAT